MLIFTWFRISVFWTYHKQKRKEEEEKKEKEEEEEDDLWMSFSEQSLQKIRKLISPPNSVTSITAGANKNVWKSILFY